MSCNASGAHPRLTETLCRRSNNTINIVFNCGKLAQIPIYIPAMSDYTRKHFLSWKSGDNIICRTGSGGTVVPVGQSSYRLRQGQHTAEAELSRVEYLFLPTFGTFASVAGDNIGDDSVKIKAGPGAELI